MDKEMQKLVGAIKKSNSIALFSHINPDGDTVGSASALYFALKAYGKSVYLFCDSPIVSKIKVMDGVEYYNAEALPKYDLAITVDCSDLSRLGDMYGEYEKGYIKACVDHHETNPNFAQINVVEPNASATAEVMYKLIVALDKNLIDDRIAKLLYSGMITDSGCFSFSSVSTQTHSIAAELIKFNINASELCDYYTKMMPKKVFDLRMSALSKAKFYFDNKLAIILFTQEMFSLTNTGKEFTDGTINELININEVEIAIAMTEVNDKLYKCSIRTTEKHNSADIALAFGGGGHNRAAGFALCGYLEDVKDKIIRECGFALGE